MESTDSESDLGDKAEGEVGSGESKAPAKEEGVGNA